MQFIIWVTYHLHMFLPSLMQKSLSASIDYDPAGASSGLTPSKGSPTDFVDDMESVQLSSTKLIKYVKKKKSCFNFLCIVCHILYILYLHILYFGWCWHTLVILDQQYCLHNFSFVTSYLSLSLYNLLFWLRFSLSILLNVSFGIFMYWMLRSQ